MVLPAYIGALDGKRQRETALITGASSGIGLDLAQLMAPNFDLIITARNQPQLEKIAQELQAAHGNHVHVVPADLTLPEAPQQMFAEIERRGLPVDILINNAGFGLYGAFAAERSQDFAKYSASKHFRAYGTHQARAAGDDSTETWKDYERGIYSGISTGAAHGRLLRDEGLRNYVF